MSLPPALERFIARSIDSIETVEILLLLARTPDTYWTAEALESHLGMRSGSGADRRLAFLAENGLVVRGASGGYRYAAASDEQRQLVADLAVAYSERRAAVVNTVFSENLARLRAFAEAFRVKRE